MIKLVIEQDVNIELKHKGILEVPEDKNVDDLPLSHFVDLADRKGLSKITKALNNLQVWNKNKDPKLSKWAANMIDKLNKKFEERFSMIKKLNINESEKWSEKLRITESNFGYDNLEPDAKNSFKKEII